MKRIFVVLMVFSWVFVCVHQAEAQDDAQAYWGIFAGAVFPEDLELQDTKDPIVSLEDLDLNTGFMVGAKIGAWLTENRALAVETEANYVDGVDVDNQFAYTSSNTNVNVEATCSLFSLFANVILKYPDGRLHPYMGAGVGWTWFNFNDVRESANLGGFAVTSGTLEDDDNSPAFQLLGGLDVDIGENSALVFGLRYVYTEPELDTVGVNVVYKAIVATAGVDFRF